MNSPWDDTCRIVHLQDRMANYPEWLAEQTSRLETLMPCSGTGGNGAFCSNVTKAQCERWLNFLCGEILDRCIEHFGHENALMHMVQCHPQISEHFARHMADHGDLMERLVAVIDSPTPCSLRAGLRDLLGNRFMQHLRDFDVELLNRLRAAPEPEKPAGKVAVSPAAAGETSTAPPKAADFSGRASSCAP